MTDQYGDPYAETRPGSHIERAPADNRRPDVVPAGAQAVAPSPVFQQDITQFAPSDIGANLMLQMNMDPWEPGAQMTRHRKVTEEQRLDGYREQTLVDEFTFQSPREGQVHATASRRQWEADEGFTKGRSWETTSYYRVPPAPAPAPPAVEEDPGRLPRRGTSYFHRH